MRPIWGDGTYTPIWGDGTYTLEVKMGFQLNRYLKLTIIISSFLFLCSFKVPNPITMQEYKYALGISKEKQSSLVITHSKDLSYPGSNNNQLYDLYHPTDYLQKKYPIFIWIHGGGFWAGDKADGMDAAIAKAIAGQGYIVASINYTLVTIGKPETAFPAAQKDVEKFVTFVRENLKNINADLSTPINIGGASAGAYLALYQATSSMSALHFRCVIDAFGPVDVNDNNFLSTSTRIRNVALTASDSALPSLELRQSFSPINRISNFQGMVALILHSQKDTLVPIHQSLMFESALVKQDIKVMTHYISTKSNVGPEDHDYPLDVLIENIQGFLSTETCKNLTISLSCTQDVKKGETINCLTHLESKRMKSFHWVVNGKKMEDSENKIAYSWSKIGAGTYSAQIVGVDLEGKTHMSNFVTREVK